MSIAMHTPINREEESEMLTKFQVNEFLENIWTLLISTLNSPNIMGHKDFLESILVLIMRIDLGHTNFQSTLQI